MMWLSALLDTQSGNRRFSLGIAQGPLTNRANRNLNQQWSRASGSNSNFNTRSAYDFTLSSHQRHYTCLRAGPGKLLGFFSMSCGTMLTVLTAVYVYLFEHRAA